MGCVPKALITRDGEPLILRQVRILVEAGILDIVVVLGYYAMQISEVLEKARWSGKDTPTSHAHLKWTINPAPDEDPASSLRCGLKTLSKAHDPVLVLLGDQPLLEAADIAVMAAAWRTREEDAELLLPEHEGALGHPVVFSAAVREAVLAGAGVREWRETHAAQVQKMATGHDRTTCDVDTPEDIRSLQQRTGVSLQLPTIKR